MTTETTEQPAAEQKAAPETAAPEAAVPEAAAAPSAERRLGAMLLLSEDVVKAAGWEEPRLAGAFNDCAQWSQQAGLWNLLSMTGIFTGCGALAISIVSAGFFPLAVGAGAVAYIAHNQTKNLREKAVDLRMAVLDDVAHNTVTAPKIAAAMNAAPQP